jgi:hypothetical protein
MGLILWAALAAAVMQPAETQDVTIVPPRPQGEPQPAPPPRVRLPFETGQLVFNIRAWASGAMRCDARGLGASFEAAATDFCSFASTFAQDGATDGDPIVEIDNVVTLTRAGDTPASLPENPGRISFDAEAEVEVSPDGSVTACRMLQGERSDGAAGELRPDTFCRDMLQSPPSFQPWTGGGPRHGRVRVTVFNSGISPPAAD